jgi:hypothetical protein
LAPVALEKSGARRCKGSAICGPVKVTTRIVTPLNFWPELVLDPPPQAATNAAATSMTRAFARYRLM